MSTAPVSPTPITWAHAERQQHFEQWLTALVPMHGLAPETLAPASSDASFRRYLRLAASGVAGGHCIVMDAPPPQEDVRPFVHVAGLIEQAGLLAPRVLAQDPDQGFLLLTDLGNDLLLNALETARPAEADTLMRAAARTLVQWQQGVPGTALPAFDGAVLQEELDLFPQWCVQRAFGVRWSATEQARWQRVCQLLVDSACAQPRVAVHRDWMPRNLMVCDGAIGILDFQDAARGPLTYDMASLLRDAFLSWDEEQELDWGVRYWQMARDAGLPVDADFGEFWRQLEWMGLQRHLRILGVFCRLQHRDGKPHYARDLPRFFGYATKVALRYRELAPLLPLLEPLSGQAVQAGYTF